MSKSIPNKDLIGKGLRSLLQNMDAEYKNPAGKVQPAAIEKAVATNRVALANIVVNPKNPRKDFDQKALQELANSIKLHDIIQPLTVSSLSDGKYQLIAGERRFRAAKLAGLLDVPAYIRQVNDKELLELALLENLQRVDLNEIEIALSYQRMMDELSYTQEQVADRMGKDRSTVANVIRLLRLPPAIQLSVRRGELSMGHARALIALDVVDAQLVAFKEILAKGLSVRQTEALVQQLKKSLPAVKKTTNSTSSSPYKRIEDKLASHFSTRVKIKTNKDGSGQLIIEYYTQEEFNKILGLLNAPLD